MSRRRVVPAMEPHTKYLEFARECERLAGEPRLKQHRAALLEMAQLWRDLAAKEVEGGKEQNGD
jgi:hypothetical protein